MKSPALSDYKRAIKRTMPWLLLLSLAISLLVFGIIRRQGPTYEMHFSYIVSLRTREAAPDFRFDGYYALQATNLFSETVAAWIMTPEIIVAAHEAKGVPLGQKSPRVLQKSIEAEQAAPQLVHVIVRGKEQEQVLKLSQGLKTVMARAIEEYHDQGIPAVEFTAVATEPWLGVQEAAAPLVAAALFTIIFLLGINFVVLWESVRQSGWVDDEHRH